MEGDTLLGVTSTSEAEKALHRTLHRSCFLPVSKLPLPSTATRFEIN